MLLISSILLLIYYFYPGARIFQMHTSGRFVHWAIIFNTFDFNNIYTGMGAGSSSKYLIDFGVGATMARAHNEFLTYFYDLGLLGFFGLICILKLIHSSSSNNGRIIFFTIVLQMLTDNILTYYFNYLLPLVLCCLLEHDLSLEKENSSNITEKL